MNADDLAKILDELGKRLGPTGSHVFELAVRQVYADAIVRLAFFGPALTIGTVVALRWFRGMQARRWARWNELPAHEKNYPTLNGRPGFAEEAIVYVIAAIVGFFIVSMVMFNVVALINPEYAAIRSLLDAVRTGL